MHPFYGPINQFLQAGNYWWLGLASMAMYLLFWAVVIIIAFTLFKKYIVRMNHPKDSIDTAMSILRERYAKGEIDAEEYKLKKADLEETTDKTTHS
jgi:putative membrane protein